MMCDGNDKDRLTVIKDRSIDFVLLHEGGFVNHPRDPGGATNWGISLRFLRSTDKWRDYDANKDGELDAADMKALTREQAKDLYSQFFWRPYEGVFKLLPEGTAMRCFDHAVNAGHRSAFRILQRTTWTIDSRGRALADDGIAGRKTKDFLYQDGALLLPEAYKSERAGWYRLLAYENPNLSMFLQGWLNRAYH